MARGKSRALLTLCLDPNLKMFGLGHARTLVRSSTILHVKVLDLYSGAGGAAMGYHLAGFQVVGIDIEPQPRYPFTFYQADALDALADVSYLQRFDFIHASPPCQLYTHATLARDRSLYPDLLPPTREALKASGVPYVIENVPGAPMENPFMLCGSTFPNLKVRRHRLFDTTFPHPKFMMCRHREQGKVVSVFGNPGGRSARNGGKHSNTQDWRDAMGIQWMTAVELKESIPPAYTHYIGLHVRNHLSPVFEGVAVPSFT